MNIQKIFKQTIKIFFLSVFLIIAGVSIKAATTNGKPFDRDSVYIVTKLNGKGAINIADILINRFANAAGALKIDRDYQTHIDGDSLLLQGNTGWYLEVRGDGSFARLSSLHEVLMALMLLALAPKLQYILPVKVR